MYRGINTEDIIHLLSKLIIINTNTTFMFMIHLAEVELVSHFHGRTTRWPLADLVEAQLQGAAVSYRNISVW